MNILFFTQWYRPEPAVLHREMAQTWQAMGHQVTVLTGFPNYPSGEIYPGYKVRPWQREVVEGVPVVRVALYPEHSRSGAKRALNYLSFALSSTLLGRWLVPRPDVMFVYHPPLTVGVPAWVMSRLWNVPFVYQIQDMWPETLQATGMLNNQQILGYIGAHAMWVYRKADAICVISPGFRSNLIQKGVPPDKIHVISNWVDSEEYRPLAPDPEFANEHGLRERFNVMYAGNVGEAQALDVLLDAALLLADVPQVQFVVVGDGLAAPRLREAAASRKLESIRFLGRFPPAQMPQIYAHADVLLVHLRDDPLFRITIPHKVFTCMASGKPLLAAVAGDTEDLVSAVGAGITCPPGNPEALAGAVRRFLAMSPEQRSHMGQLAREAAVTRFSRQESVAKLAQVLENTVRARSNANGRRP